MGKIRGLRASTMLRYLSRYSDGYKVCLDQQLGKNPDATFMQVKKIIAEFSGEEKTCIGNDHHYTLDDSTNAWWIDLDDLCNAKHLCHKNPDGSYDIEFTIEFWPQRWFYLGLLISGATFAGCLAYIGYGSVCVWNQKRNKESLSKNSDTVSHV